jgi:hypothetical protein
MAEVSFRRLHTATFVPGREVCFLHQSSYPLAREASPLVLQLSVDPWTSISPLMVDKYLPNLLLDLSIFSLVLASRTLQPGILAAFGHFEHLAHHHYRKFMLVLFDKLILHLDSREKMLTTFLVCHALAGLFLIPV